MPLFEPLPQPRRDLYLDIYKSERTPGCSRPGDEEGRGPGVGFNYIEPRNSYAS